MALSSGWRYELNADGDIAGCYDRQRVIAEG
jgi:hypothetical protein